jgi:sigma-B regulation protein RsbU (phosphoserine phosphatase)
MSLRTRITVVVIAAVLALGLLLGFVSWQRDKELTRRNHDMLLRSQSIAWTRLQNEAAANLRAALAGVLADPGLARAWATQDRQALSKLVDPVLGQHSGWRIDWFDQRRSLVQSSSSALQQNSLVDIVWLSRLLADDAPLSGLSQPSHEDYYLVVAQGFGEPGSRGALAVGLRLDKLLPEMAGSVQGQSALINLRGREVSSTLPGLIDLENLAGTARLARVDTLRGKDQRDWLMVTLPLKGLDGRPMGAMLSMWDTTQQRLADLRMEALAVVAALLFAGALGWLTFLYLRYAMRPLQRSVGVLHSLAQGDLRAAPDEGDMELPDESGQIARGVAALRDEMMNLAMLRDERARVGAQQERLIRRELRRLASSLDADTRAEVLSVLEPTAAPDSEKDQNSLVELAGILGRMSGLVLSQQDRLVGLLNQLREAMVQQAALVSLRQELEIARTLQLSVLPRAEPDTSAAHVSALMIPAKEVGGDFYDYFVLDEQRLALVIADVSGKGVPAAFFMAISRTLLKSIASFMREPAQVIERLNDELCADNEQTMFVTAFFGVLDLTTGTMEYVNAGHCVPLLQRADKTVETLPPQGQNVALAVMDGLPFTQARLQFAPGDTLLLYTDGVTEAANAEAALFGDARLMDLIRSGVGVAAEDLPQFVLQAVRNFEAGAAQADDITMVALRYVGAAQETA